MEVNTFFSSHGICRNVNQKTRLCETLSKNSIISYKISGVTCHFFQSFVFCVWYFQLIRSKIPFLNGFFFFYSSEAERFMISSFLYKEFDRCQETLQTKSDKYSTSKISENTKISYYEVLLLSSDCYLPRVIIPKLDYIGASNEQSFFWRFAWEENVRRHPLIKLWYNFPLKRIVADLQKPPHSSNYCKDLFKEINQKNNIA